MNILNVTGELVIVNNGGCFTRLQHSGIEVRIEKSIIVGSVFASGFTVEGDSVVGLPDPCDNTIVVVTKEVGAALAGTSYRNYAIAEVIDGILIATI